MLSDQGTPSQTDLLRGNNHTVKIIKMMTVELIPIKKSKRCSMIFHLIKIHIWILIDVPKSAVLHSTTICISNNMGNDKASLRVDPRKEILKNIQVDQNK